LPYVAQCVPVAPAVPDIVPPPVLLLLAAVSVVPVALLVVTGGPPPVSVAVVPVVCGAGCSVSVEPAVLSAGFRLHPATITTSATATAATSVEARVLLCIQPPFVRSNTSATRLPE
jgi:hypothetical protein